MAWFRNHYECERCEHEWSDEWSSTCDDDCPNCGARHMSPYESDDLTEIVEERDGKFIALRSRESAEDEADYEEIAVICEVPPGKAQK
jgi:predicted  nucleic acid-binding Zn-ribbon protein